MYRILLLLIVGCYSIKAQLRNQDTSGQSNILGALNALRPSQLLNEFGQSFNAGINRFTNAPSTNKPIVNQPEPSINNRDSGNLERNPTIFDVLNPFYQISRLNDLITSTTTSRNVNNQYKITTQKPQQIPNPLSQFDNYVPPNNYKPTNSRNSNDQGSNFIFATKRPPPILQTPHPALSDFEIYIPPA